MLLEKMDTALKNSVLITVMFVITTLRLMLMSVLNADLDMKLITVFILMSAIEQIVLILSSWIHHQRHANLVLQNVKDVLKTHALYVNMGTISMNQVQTFLNV